MKTRFFISFLLLITVLLGCRREDPQLGEPPTAADAEFTYSPSPENDNIIIFTANNANVLAKWDLGNETKAEGTTVQGIYPLAGTYVVTLTVFTSGGSASTTQEIVIAEDDPSLLDKPVFNYLTGGQDIGSKTWVIDSVVDAHFGVGPNPIEAAGATPEWYAATACEKAGAGFYNDRYTFSLIGFKFDMITNGDVYLNAEQAGNFQGAAQADVGDYTAPYTDQIGESWNILEEDGKTFLSVTGDAFIGYYTGVKTYEIISLNEDEMFLRQLDAANDELSWYLRLVPEGSFTGGCDVSGGGGGGGGGDDSTATYSLPIDFETEDVIFTSFGEAADSVIDNPDTTGINSSSRVLEIIDGVETWAGSFVDLDAPLDFSTNTVISVKIWAPGPGTLRIKLEDSNDSNTFVEKDVNFTKTQEWEEVSIDFAGEASNTYDRLVLFPGWGQSNAGTFYLDDITQQ